MCKILPNNAAHVKERYLETTMRNSGVCFTVFYSCIKTKIFENPTLLHLFWDLHCPYQKTSEAQWSTASAPGTHAHLVAETQKEGGMTLVQSAWFHSVGTLCFLLYNQLRLGSQVSPVSPHQTMVITPPLAHHYSLVNKWLGPGQTIQCSTTYHTFIDSYNLDAFITKQYKKNKVIECPAKKFIWRMHEKNSL